MDGISEALGRLVSGCFVLTLPRDGTQPEMGLLVSFVQQVGFAPPRLTFAIRQGRPVVERLISGAACVLNICASDDTVLLKRFAGGVASGQDPFAGLALQRSADGTILEDSAGFLVCTIAARFDTGDHWLFLADVRGGRTIGDRRPYVHVRRNGLAY